MRMKKVTIEKYIEEVEQHLSNNDYKSALAIAGRYPLKMNYIITQTRALDEYDVKREQLMKVSHIEKTNPRYFNAPTMKIYLVRELETLFKRKAPSKIVKGFRTKSWMSFPVIKENFKEI